MRLEEPQCLVERTRIGGENISCVGIAGIARFNAKAMLGSPLLEEDATELVIGLIDYHNLFD